MSLWKRPVFLVFFELPPGDVCPREKTSEEPSGDVCPRGGNPRDGRSGIFSRKKGWPSEVCKGPNLRKGSSCVFDQLNVGPSWSKISRGCAARYYTQTPVENFQESCLIVIGRLVRRSRKRAFSRESVEVRVLGRGIITPSVLFFLRYYEAIS